MAGAYPGRRGTEVWRRLRRNGENRTMKLDAAADRVREVALSFPEAYEDAPWGFPVFKVRDNRMFAWMIVRDESIEVTVKLTQEEREIAQLLPYVARARYVGRYGWISAQVTDDESLDCALEWLRESYWLKAPAELRAAVEE
jgi:predicted DNA-binding protein (MmcQ/YjbR family)